MRRTSGMTMSDVMFLIMITCMVIIPISALFPTGRITLKKARMLQGAVTIAKRQINDRRVTFPSDLLDGSKGTIPTDTVPRTTVGQIVMDGVPYKIEESIFLVKTRPGKPVKGSVGTPPDEPVIIDVVVT